MQKVMIGVAKAFEFDWNKFQLFRGISLAGVMLLPLIVLGLVHKPEYWLSVSFGALFVGLSDPGGAFGNRASRMGAFAVIGAALTLLAFAIGSGDWVWLVLATFIVTLVGGLTLTFGTHRFIAGLFLNVWFVAALTLPGAYQDVHIATNPWAQALAWLIGSALTLAYTSILWVARGRTAHSLPAAELLPQSTTRVRLTGPSAVFVVVRALAVAGSAAIAFGLNLPNADWLPLATLVAMKPNLQQSTLVAGQRVAGTIGGAAVAALFLLTVLNNQLVLAVVIIILALAAGSIRIVNYAAYCAAVAALVLIAMGLPSPNNLANEGRRILFTLVGVAIAVITMFLLDQLRKRSTTESPEGHRG